MRLDRDFYRPKESHGCENLRVRLYEDLAGSEVWTYEKGGTKYFGMVFGGKRSKPDWHYYYVTAEKRDEAISRWVSGQRSHVERIKADRKARNAPHGFKPGQLFYASWGYDQTNVNYYRLEKLKGKTMGYIVPVSSVLNEERSEGACNYVSPGGSIRDWDVLLGVDRDDGEPGKWKRLSKHGFSCGHTSASPCSADTERYETHPMFGH